MTTETFIESDCAITHEGRTFTSGGAAIGDDYAIVYIGGSLAPTIGTMGWRDGKALGIGDWEVTDWHGTIIGRAHVTSTWRARGTRVYSYYVTIYGQPARHYNMRGQGSGMMARGRRAK